MSAAPWRAALRFALWLTVANASGCTFSDSLDHCTNSSDCTGGQTCYDGFCVRSDGSTKGTVKEPTRSDAGKSTNTDAGRTTVPPLTGDGGSDAAADGGGTDAMPDAAQDSGPAVDSGSPCQAGDMRECMLHAVTSTTAPGCNRGFMRCDNGLFGACVADITPELETCNGLDDDCDGNADEATDTVCFPADQVGCTIDAETGKVSCKGLCAVGTQLCRNGKLQACTGAIVPRAESCNSSGGLAADEDCDGPIDEGCACTGTQPRGCYAGPNGTSNVGQCRAGTQTCDNGVLGPCTGAVVPTAETCGNPNSDDDCNGITDDIQDRGADCTVATNMGICRAGKFQCQDGSADLVCVTNQPAPAELCNDLDDDCDGKTDETFMLQSDPNHCGSCSKVCAASDTCCNGQCVNIKTDSNNCGGCGMTFVCGAAGGPGSCCDGMCMDFMSDTANCGMCGHACGNSEACCAGKCVNTNTDINNCGMCGMVCSAGMQPACCSGNCADLVSDNHCGTCDHACALDTNGMMCTCNAVNGVPQCVSPGQGTCQ